MQKLLLTLIFILTISAQVTAKPQKEFTPSKPLSGDGITTAKILATTPCIDETDNSKCFCHVFLLQGKNFLVVEDIKGTKRVYNSNGDLIFSRRMM